MARRWWGSLIGVLVCAWLGVACTPGGAAPIQRGAPTGRTPPPAEAGAAAATTSVPTGEITFMAFGDAEEQHVFLAILDAYRTHNPNVTVRLNAIPNQRDFQTKLAAAFAAGTPPDVFLVNYRRFGQFAGKGVIEPVGPLLARDGRRAEEYFELPRRAFTYDGTLQCLPQNQSSLVVYYNRDRFERFGVALPRAGWTWTDFLAAAKALTRDTDADGRIDVHGLAVEPTIIRAAPFIWQRGGRLVDDEARPTRFTLDEPAAREGLRFFVELATVHRVTPNQAESKAEEPDARFMAGHAAMTLNSRRVVPEYRQIRGFTWDVAPLPVDRQAATPLHSDAYCIAAASRNQAAAWDFVAWANGPEGQTIAARLGRTVPSLEALARSSVFLDPGQAPASGHVFLDQAASMRLFPALPEWPAIENALNAEIEAAFWGGDLETAISRSQAKANEQLHR